MKPELAPLSPARTSAASPRVGKAGRARATAGTAAGWEQPEERWRGVASPRHAPELREQSRTPGQVETAANTLQKCTENARVGKKNAKPCWAFPSRFRKALVRERQVTAGGGRRRR